MRVLMIGLRGLDETLGGIEASIQALAPRLAQRGVELHIACRDRYQKVTDEPWPGVYLHPTPALYTKHLETITYSMASLRSIPQADIVHFHALGPSILAPLPRALGMKVVATVHGLDWQRPRWGFLARNVLRLGEQLAIRVPHRTVVVSKALETHFAKQGRRTHHIPNGVDIRVIPKFDHIRRFGLEPDAYLLFLGRLVSDKGLDLLLEAFGHLETPLKLAIVGRSPRGEKLEAIWRTQTKGDDRIIWCGPLRGRDKEEILAHARLQVLPSRVEGLSLALLEGMARGVCPVVSDIPGNREALGWGEEARPAGYTFKAGSANHLQQTLQEALDDHEESVRRGQRARARVQAHHDWETSADMLFALYRSLMID